jgi:hypothetical protein
MQATLVRNIKYGITALTFGVGLIANSIAHADEHDIRHGHEAFRGGEPYRTDHWVYDDRFHHGHYYPAIGYNVTVLPSGFLTLGFGSRRFFFQSGVWYEPVGVGYAVVQPPVGVFAPVLPPDYSTVWVGNVPYYYANNVYYTATQGGYVVANPPAEGTYVEAPSVNQPQALAPAPSSAPQPPNGSWYFCTSTNTYYPYAQTCAEGWKVVPAAPMPPH